MKRSFVNKEENANFYGYNVLSAGEMLQVRGGGDVKPENRDKDLFEELT